MVVIMDQLYFSVKINAPRKRVWNTMLQDETYRQWTRPFVEGSHYRGSWEEGSKIQFLDPKGQGMVSRIARNKPHEFISIEHLGFVADGEEDTDSASAKALAGARETYRLIETNGATTVEVQMDTDEQYKAMFKDMWPKALQKLKELSEQQS